MSFMKAVIVVAVALASIVLVSASSDARQLPIILTSPSPTPSASSSISTTPSNSASSSQTASLSSTQSTSISTSHTPTPTASISSSSTNSVTPSITQTATKSTSPSSSPTASISSSSTNSVTPSITQTATKSTSPSSSPTPSVSASQTATISTTPSQTATISTTASQTATISTTASQTATISTTPSQTPSKSTTGSATPSMTASPSGTSSATPSTSPTSTPTASTSPTSSPSPSPSATPIDPAACRACLPGTSGPCQAANNHCYEQDKLTGLCPPHAPICECPTCLWGDLDGPCRTDRTGGCFPFESWTYQTCPEGTFACGISPTARPTPVPSDAPVCKPCLGMSSGPCQQQDTYACWDFMSFTNGECFPNTERCQCPECVIGDGPCVSSHNDGRCQDYVDPDTRKCPADFFECGMPTLLTTQTTWEGEPQQCKACSGLSSGPCQDEQGICYDFWDADKETCPFWAAKCDCLPCYPGDGPCRGDDGVCHPYAIHATQECPEDTFECGRPEGNPNNNPVNEEGLLCRPCAGMSSGPCQEIVTGTCHPFNLFSRDTCAHGSIECICPACTTGAGPCHNINDGSCTEYQFGATCPMDHWQCGKPGNRVSASPVPSTSPSLTPTRTRTPTPSTSASPSVTPSVSQSSSTTASTSTTASHTPSASASPSTLPECRPCASGTAGECQSWHDDSCSAPDAYGRCPAGSARCACPTCAGASSGPCFLQDGTCVPFEWGTTSCPSWTWRCGGEPSPSPSPSPIPADCPACWPGTSGDCQAANGVCYPSFGSGVCPTGTKYCNTFGADPAPVSPLCTSCTSGAGYCQSPITGLCTDFFYGGVCSAGYHVCGTGGAAPTPYPDPWSGSNPDAVVIADFTVTVNSPVCTEVWIVASDVCSTTVTSYDYACLDLTVQVLPCSSSLRRLRSSTRRLRAGDSSGDGAGASTDPEPVTQVEIEVPSNVADGLPTGLHLALLVMGSAGGEMNRCERSYFDTHTSTVFGEDCPMGMYFVGFADTDTLERMSSAVASPSPTPTVSGTPAATPSASSSPAPSSSDSVSMADDGSDRAVDGPGNESGGNGDNTTVIAIAAGLGAVALVVGVLVVRSKKKKGAMKKGTIVPEPAPAKSQAGDAAGQSPSVARAAAARRPQYDNRPVSHASLKASGANRQVVGAATAGAVRSLRNGAQVAGSRNHAVMAAMMAEVADERGQQELRGPERA